MYNKLFTKILDSSIWLAPDPHRLVWITLLAAMDEDGNAMFASTKNLAARARVSDEQAADAIRAFESPDSDSGDQDNEGRRVERFPGGWHVLNAHKYRELVTRAVSRERTRERVARFRAKQSNANVTPSNERVTPSEADTEADTKTKSQRRATRIPPDFSLTEDLRSFAVSHGLNPDTTLQAFRDYWVAASKGTKLDWAATWRTWCRNEYKRKPNSVMASPNSVTTHEERARRDFDELIARREAIGLGDFRLPNKGETVTQYRAAQDSEWAARREKMKAVQRAING